ncbi:hypothetical protein E2C01_075947 [Portunus trituberculatus]|uniref:Uncharacterized protein n=1 Tax=Portunus trituberculatus TaxID=210409 RepID=A0A5B7IIF1_PORTR|nr:hypothetical protein [Portunus trituberculatus]
MDGVKSAGGVEGASRSSQERNKYVNTAQPSAGGSKQVSQAHEERLQAETLASRLSQGRKSEGPSESFGPKEGKNGVRIKEDKRKQATRGDELNLGFPGTRDPRERKGVS